MRVGNGTKVSQFCRGKTGEATNAEPVLTSQASLVYRYGVNTILPMVSRLASARKAALTSARGYELLANSRIFR